MSEVMLGLLVFIAPLTFIICFSRAYFPFSLSLLSINEKCDNSKGKHARDMSLVCLSIFLSLVMEGLCVEPYEQGK